MKSNRYSSHVVRGLVCCFLVIVILALVSPAAADDCYKYITFKNEGAFIANCKVTYEFGGYRFDKSTGNFNIGQTRKVPVPCAATSVVPTAVAVGDSAPFVAPRYKLFRAEDRCFLLKGTSVYQNWQPCDPTGTPPLLDATCWKHVELRNEGAYVANVHVSYTYRGARAEIFNNVETGLFSHGMVRRVAVPCSSDSSLHWLDPLPNPFPRNLVKGQDYCFVLKGTHPSPRYELCSVVGQTHTIAIRNYGAYATELSVAYDYNGQRMNPKTVIHAQQRGGINIPAQSTNVHISAKAIAGETILGQTIPTARSLCYEVRGGTLTTRWAYCPQ